MHQLWRISPSALKKALDPESGCERAWALDLCIPKVEDEKQQLGVELHSVQQAYLNTGKAHDRTTRVGKMAMAGLPYMPGPGSGHAEGQASLFVSGIEYTLIIDYEGPSDLVPGAPPGLPAVIDHKTSSNPSQYGLWGHEALARDEQCLVYGAKALVANKADSVFSRWIYYDTNRKSKAQPSDTVLARAEVSQNFGELVHPKAVRLIVLQNQAPGRDAPVEQRIAWANTLDPNTNACNCFRGCRHDKTRGGACRLTQTETFAQLSALSLKDVSNDNRSDVNMSKPAADLYAILSAGKGAAQAPAPTTPEPVSAAPADLAAILNAGKKVAAAKGPSVRPPAPPAQVVELPKNDPINAPERPATVTIPEKGADLKAHLASVQAAPSVTAPVTSRFDLAAQFAAGMLANPASCVLTVEQIADRAFTLADVMLRAR